MYGAKVHMTVALGPSPPRLMH